MRYHFSGKGDEANSSSSAFTIWSTGNLQAPNILKTIQNPIGAETNYAEGLSSLYSLDAVSPSQKRKILDCEKGDFEERFRKIQRKKQLQRVAVKANLVVDDDDDDSDEEDEIYEQMDWIEKENEAVNMHTWDSSDEEEEYDEDDDDESYEDVRPNTSVLIIPRSKWKEERRRLLRISMAKIRRVEDPEAYLRRSVLINNTVKRLQKDVSINLACHSVPSTSFFQGNVAYQNESVNNWESENANNNVICKQNHSEASFGVEYAASVLNSDTVVHFGDPPVHSDLSCNPVHLHLAFASTFSSDKAFDTPQHEILHNSTFNKTVLEEQRLSEASISPIILKQPSTLHLFSSQPCGLQYRNVVQDEDSGDEYDSPNTSSILDSVVYHSLVASLET